MTNHIIIRGMYEKITLCIYGLPHGGTEGHILLDTAKNDVPLEKLSNYEEYQQQDKINLTNDDIELLNNYTIDSLISPYIKCEVIGGLKKAYFINPPNLNMVEKTKTGYIYYENDLNYYSQCLYNFYLNENKTNKNNKYPISITGETVVSHPEEIISNVISFQTYFKKISNIIKILISNNSAFLDDDSVFSHNNFEIFHKIPDITVDIIIFALQGKIFGYSEITYGLKLLKIITNSAFLVSKFVDKNGLENLYNLILNKQISLVIKVLVLEIIYAMITYNKAFSRFMENIDKSKFQQQYFMIKESARDGDLPEKEQKEREVPDKKRGRSPDKDRKRSRKKSKKDKKSSRTPSRSRSRTYSRGSSSDNSNMRKRKKKQSKNVLLKNGYQIILTLIIEKRNNLIINIIRKIVNKVSFLLYLKEFGNFAENLVSNFFNLVKK